MTSPSVRRSSLVALLIGALCAASCAEQDPNAENASVAPSERAAINEGQQAAPKPRRLMLSGDGLIAAGEPAGSTRKIAFGSAQPLVMKAISGILGAPDQQGDNAECPAGPVQFASWNKGLVANFQDGKFVGWGGAVDLRTERGIGFGSSRAELDKAYDPVVEESSLGVEFNADGLSGILESNAADAAITEIWAGVTCVAR